MDVGEPGSREPRSEVPSIVQRRDNKEPKQEQEDMVR